MSTHIDRNQTIVSHLKTLTSSKTENDLTPEKDSAFKQIQGILSSMEDKQRPLEDEMEQLKEILKNFGGTSTEVRLITSLSKKIEDKLGEMQKLQGDVEEQSATLSSADSEEVTTDDGTDVSISRKTYSSGMTVGSGAQAQAAQILLELQEKYSELQALLQKIVQQNLSHSTDIVTSLSTAASDSAHQDAENQRQERYNALAGAFTSGFGAAFTVGSTIKSQYEMKPVQAQQANLHDHLKELQDTNPANPTISNAPRPARPSSRSANPDEVAANANLKKYTKTLKTGNFATRGEDATHGAGRQQARRDAYTHMRSKDRASIAKMLNERSTEKSNEISTIQTKHSRIESIVSSANQVATSGVKALTEGNQAANTDNKAAREGQRAVSQDSAEKQNQLVQKSKDDANQAAQQGGQVLKVRESIIENNRAAR
jgi:hypothetical protein